MTALSLKIVSPTDIVFDGEVDFVVVPGIVGQLGILPQHAPLLSTLKKGQIRLKQGAAEKAFELAGGFVEVLENKVTVLSEDISYGAGG